MSIPQGTFYLRTTNLVDFMDFWDFHETCLTKKQQKFYYDTDCRPKRRLPFPNLYTLCMKVPKYLLTYSNYQISSYSQQSLMYSQTNLCVRCFCSIDKQLPCKMTWLRAYLNYLQPKIEFSTSSSYLKCTLLTSKHVL